MDNRKESRKPNLLFLYTDEQAVSTMPCYGNNLIEAPYLKALGEKSFVFERAYCSQSVCTPSRSTLLTGLYPHSTGCTENNIPLSTEVKCLPELADFSGYRTGHFGKWHLGDEVFAQHGFREWVSIDDAYRRYYRPERDKSAYSSYHQWLCEKGFKPGDKLDRFDFFSRSYTARLPEEYSKPAYLAGEAGRFIRENRDNPFILYVNFLEPHMPFYGPRDGQHNPEGIPLPPNFNASPAANQPFKTQVLRYLFEKRGTSGLPLKTEEDWKKLISNYWGLVSLVDTYTGRILGALDENGVAENTIVVFTSDHGDMMGSHRLVAKCVQFEEAVRVPLLLHVPWLKPERVSPPVSQVDIVPTLLELMGKPVPGSLQGKSRASYLEGKEKPFPGEDVFIEWNGANCGMGLELPHRIALPEIVTEAFPEDRVARAVSDPVRTVITPDGWKFNWSASGENELYNLADDPGETKNLIGKPEFKNLVKELYEKITAFQERTEDALSLNPSPRRGEGE